MTLIISYCLMLIRSLLMGLPHSVGISYLLFDTFPSFYFPMSKSTDLSVFICSFLSSLPLPCCDTHTHSLEKTTHDKRKDLRKVPNGGLIRVSFSCWLRKKRVFSYFEREKFRVGIVPAGYALGFPLSLWVASEESL